jgi:hypothetical protein
LVLYFIVKNGLKHLLKYLVIIYNNNKRLENIIISKQGLKNIKYLYKVAFSFPKKKIVAKIESYI